MDSRILFHILMLRKRLWAKPLIYCVLAVVSVFLAGLADGWAFAERVPRIESGTVETLLSIISTTMLAVATFAVGSMVSAYNSASQSGTPRAFAVVVSDDMSQIALSSFIGAFIFSIVGIIALKTGLYERAGLFALFVLTLMIFGWVILTFVRWVDSIARLGRMGNTIDRVEAAARDCLDARRKRPNMGGVPPGSADPDGGEPIHAPGHGYVQHIAMDKLQALAKDLDIRVRVAAVPGTFLAPGKVLGWVLTDGPAPGDEDLRCLAECFLVGNDRTFAEDPRFGLIVLSEIAGRALSPGINDPGTAIVIIGRYTRLFALWAQPPEQERKARYDRIEVPDLTLAEMFDDAFTVIARDGADKVEVGIRLQKAFLSLASTGENMAREARRHSALAMKRAEAALTAPEDLGRVRAIAERLARG